MVVTLLSPMLPRRPRLAFLAGFLAAFLAAARFADFLAEGFLAADFLASGFLADFLAEDCLAADFFAACFLAAGFLADVNNMRFSLVSVVFAATAQRILMITLKHNYEYFVNDRKIV